MNDVSLLAPGPEFFATTKVVVGINKIPLVQSWGWNKLSRGWNDVSLLAPGPELSAGTVMTIKRSRGRSDVALLAPGSVFLTNAFQRERGSFPCFFLFGTPVLQRGKALLHCPQNLSFCFPFVCCWRPIIGVVWWGFFFFGSKSVRKLLSKWRIPRFSSQVLCRLRNKAAQEIGSCGRRRRRTWIWEWKRKRFFFGFFFFPPYVVRIILKNNKNKKDAQETSSENLFLEVKSCCSLRVRFGNLS